LETDYIATPRLETEKPARGTRTGLCHRSKRVLDMARQLPGSDKHDIEAV
jgi:hypothetical protein